MAIFYSEIKNGRQANRRSMRPDDLRGTEYDEAILASLDRGRHYASLINFSFVLRKGEQLTAIYGTTDSKDFHDICMALKTVTLSNHIVEL